MRQSAWFTPLEARLLLAFASLVALGSTRVAHAQPAHDDRVQNVIFDDDLLNGDLGAPFGAQVFPGHMPPARVLLIRPRTQFVTELLKSVENL